MTSKMTSKTISKADLSTNWREPLPANLAKKLAPPPTPILRAPTFRTRAFAKKPVPTMNPFPEGPWRDLKEYKMGLKCSLCKTTIRKNLFPQELDCGHIFCAECIHKHYYIENNKKCPTCSDYIYEQDDPSFCRECWSAPCECRLYDRDDDSHSYYDDDDEPMCPCRDGGCYGDCGTLSCGCVDVCRGRCDPDGYGFGFF